MNKQYGTYAYMPCDPETPTSKKLELVRIGLDKVIEKIKACDVELNLNTLKIWVNEDMDFGEPDPDWYADEKPGYVFSGPVWRIIVAAKAEAAKNE